MFSLFRTRSSSVGGASTPLKWASSGFVDVDLEVVGSLGE